MEECELEHGAADCFIPTADVTPLKSEIPKWADGTPNEERQHAFWNHEWGTGADRSLLDCGEYSKVDLRHTLSFFRRCKKHINGYDHAFDLAAGSGRNTRDFLA